MILDVIDLDAEEQRRLAYHEAGHAVVQHLLGWKLKLVGIGRIAEHNQSWTGSTQTEKEEGLNGAVIAVAGPLAEGRYLNVAVSDDDLIDGRRPNVDFDDGGWEGDAETLRHFASETEVKRCIETARSLVEQADVWAAISTIADELANPARVKKALLKDMPDDVRAAVLPAFCTSNHDSRPAAYCFFRGEEVSAIITEKRALMVST